MLYTCNRTEKLLKGYLIEVKLGHSETLHEYLAVKELKGNLCFCNGLAVLYVFSAVCDSDNPKCQYFNEQVYVHC